MENRLIVNHQRCRISNPPKIKKILFEDYKGDFGMDFLEIDHVVPFSISEDSSLENLQLLNYTEHRRKTRIDLGILKIFRKKKWTLFLTNYSCILIKPKKFLKEEYLKLYKKMEAEGYGVQDVL